MKIIYDNLNRVVEIKFAKGENQEAFWENLRKSQEAYLNSYVEVSKQSQEEYTKRVQIIHDKFSNPFMIPTM